MVAIIAYPEPEIAVGRWPSSDLFHDLVAQNDLFGQIYCTF